MTSPLFQTDVDAAFGSVAEPAQKAPGIELFDVKKLDTIPKSQLQSLHMLHENFARNLASTLSAYLRSYVMLNMVSLEQLSYGDFLEGVSSPACIAYLGLHPFDGTAILDLNTNLVFRFLELLLGSKEQSTVSYQRKITDIEKRLMQTLLRIMLHDLQESWRSVAEIDFTVQSLASEPQLSYLLTPSEAMIVIAIEVRLGPTSGLMNLAIPAIFIKRLRNNFDELQRFRKINPSEDDQLHVAGLLQDVQLKFDVRLPGGLLSVRTLMDLKVGDVLTLDCPSHALCAALVNGREKWLGQVLSQNGHLAFQASTEIVTANTALSG